MNFSGIGRRMRSLGALVLVSLTTQCQDKKQAETPNSNSVRSPLPAWAVALTLPSPLTSPTPKPSSSFPPSPTRAADDAIRDRVVNEIYDRLELGGVHAPKEYLQTGDLTSLVSAGASVVEVGPAHPTVQSAVAALPPAGGVVLVPPGVYTERVTLRSNMVLRGAGLGTVLVLPPNIPRPNVDTAVLTVQDQQHIVIENLVIDGNQRNEPFGVEQFYGIEILTIRKPTGYVLIRDVTIKDSYGDAILAFYRGTHHVLIENNVLLNSGRNAVTIDSGSGLVVRNNYMKTDATTGGAFQGLFGVDIGDDDDQIHEVVVEQNRFGGKANIMIFRDPFGSVVRDNEQVTIEVSGGSTRLYNNK